MVSLKALKIIALFVILVCGFGGVTFPQALSSMTHDDSFQTIFLLCKTFSAGIILGTGFIHMFPEAQEMIQTAYPNIEYQIGGFVAGLACICLMALEQVINKYFHKSKGKHQHQHVPLSNSLGNNLLTCGTNKDINARELVRVKTQEHDIDGNSNGSADEESRGHHDGHDHHNKEDQRDGKHCHTINIIYETDLTFKKIVTVYILELGIAIHSIIIGVTLGTTTEQSTFTYLFFAMALHQFFEGIALGSSIVKANINEKWKVIGMMLFFSLTTPIGIAIGLIINGSYNSESDESYATQGILNAVSAGILIYMALIHLIIEDFNNNEIEGIVKFAMFVSILAGYAVTAIMAIWT